MTITALCKGFTLACVFIWEVRPSQNYTGHGHGLSTLTCFFSSLLNIHFQEGFWAIGCCVFSSFVQWGMLFGCWFIFQLSLLASSVNLFVDQEELCISLLTEMSHLQQECLYGGSDYVCRKGLVLQMTSWKYLHCPFSYPNGTSNEIKTRILRFSFTVCGESENSPGEWKSYPLQYSGLDNSMDCKNHVTAEILTRLSTYNVPCLSEK